MASLIVGRRSRGGKRADDIAEGRDPARPEAPEIATAVDQLPGGVVPALAHLSQRIDAVRQLAGGVVHLPGALAGGVDAPGEPAGGGVAIARREIASAPRARTKHGAGSGDFLHTPSQVVELILHDVLVGVR